MSSDTGSKEPLKFHVMQNASEGLSRCYQKRSDHIPSIQIDGMYMATVVLGVITGHAQKCVACD